MNVDADIQVGIEREMVRYTGESSVAHSQVKSKRGATQIQCHRIALCIHPATHKDCGDSTGITESRSCHEN